MLVRWLIMLNTKAILFAVALMGKMTTAVTCNTHKGAVFMIHYIIFTMTAALTIKLLSLLLLPATLSEAIRAPCFQSAVDIVVI